MTGINIRQWQLNVLKNGSGNCSFFPLLFAAFILWAAILQTEPFHQNFPHTDPVSSGIECVKIKDTAGKMAPGTAEYVFAKVDIQMLLPWTIVAARAGNVIVAPAVRWVRNADQRDNISYMDFDHAASFPGDGSPSPQ